MKNALRNHNAGIGLGILPPTPRLLTVLILTSSFALISTLLLATVAFSLSIGVLLLSTRRRVPPLVLITMTLFLYFIATLIFSFDKSSTSHFYEAYLNVINLKIAAVAGLKRSSMLALSLAWLVSTPIPQMYSALHWCRPIRRWTGLLLRDIQVIKQQVVAMRQSLRLRDKECVWYDLGGHFRQFSLLLQGLIIHTFGQITAMTYVAETHFHSPLVEGCSINIRQLSAKYSSESYLALSNINVTISPGEFVYLGGKNRAGKSTLLRCISGAIPNLMGSRSGTIEIGHIDIRDRELRDIAAYVRYVPPDPSQSILGVTVAQDILELAASPTVAGNCLRTMGITGLWDRETTTLSGGEQVRLVLAGILAAETPVVLLDSPLEQLDASGRQDFLCALKAFQERRSCTIIVSDLAYEYLRPFITRILILEDGCLTDDCAPDSLTRDFIARMGLDFEQTVPRSSRHASENDPTPLGALENVTVVLDGKEVLHSLSLDICASECVAVLGPNGGGKSTALLSLAGVIPLTAGVARVRTRVGYVFQNASLQFLELSSRAELSLGPRLCGWESSAIEAFVEHQLNWCGLIGDEWPIDIHPGQVRLLAMASMNVNLGIIVLDEPSIGLDYDDIAKVAAFIRLLTANGLGVFVVTHDRHLAQIADRAILIVEGAITATGSPQAMFDQLLALQEHDPLMEKI